VNPRVAWTLWPWNGPLGRDFRTAGANRASASHDVGPPRPSCPCSPGQPGDGCGSHPGGSRVPREARWSESRLSIPRRAQVLSPRTAILNQGEDDRGRPVARSGRGGIRPRRLRPLKPALGCAGPLRPLLVAEFATSGVSTNGRSPISRCWCSRRYSEKFSNRFTGSAVEALDIANRELGEPRSARVVTSSRRHPTGTLCLLDVGIREPHNP
jgi:hypothetical protein